MKCKNCGAYTDPNDKYCQICGLALEDGVEEVEVPAKSEDEIRETSAIRAGRFLILSFILIVGLSCFAGLLIK